MSCAVFSSFERMITNWPLAGGSVIPSFCWAAARTVAPVEPCSFDWTAATWLERPTVAASWLTSVCRFRLTTPDWVETTGPPPFSTLSSSLCAAMLA